MDGFKLVKAFYAECAINEPMQIGCTGNHHSLYTWICELRNRIRANQPTREIIDLPVRYTMEMSFIGSDNTLKKCIDHLEEWGIIEIIQRGTNQHVPTKVKFAVAYLHRHNCDSDAIAERLQSDSTAIALRPTKTVKTSKTVKTKRTDIDMTVEGLGHLVGRALTMEEYQQFVSRHDKSKVGLALEDFEIKVAYRQNVTLYPKEYQTLQEKYSAAFAVLCLDKLHFAKLSKEYTYKSDYGAINSWVVKAVKKDQDEGTRGSTSNGGLVV